MFLNRSQVLDVVYAGFFGKTVLVVGDVMLDRYVWGEVTRISPEAPVPVVRVTRETDKGGGAAHVALNLANLGIQTSVVGWVGEDAAGQTLRDILAGAMVDVRGLRVLGNRATITKTRIIGGRQQMLRMDREAPRALEEASLACCVRQVWDRLHRDAPPDALVLSDYGKGVLTGPVCRTVIAAASEVGVPVFVDPKGVDYRKYRGATALTPNRRELAEAVSLPSSPLAPLLAAGQRLCRAQEVAFLAVTLSEHGIALLEGDADPYTIPALAREVYDVSGAGDTVIATMAAGLTAGLARYDALQLANVAAGVVVGKVGTTPITRAALLSALSDREALAQADKTCTLEAARVRVEQWRQRGEVVVFTNGCFDLLHAGHVSYLEKARQRGGRLVVGLNSDRSVRALKGASRPVIQEEDRARVLAAMVSVDLVVVFDEATPLNLIKTLRPDILAKGADYREDQVVGAAEVKTWGGRVALIPLVTGRSSSEIVARIKDGAGGPVSVAGRDG